MKKKNSNFLGGSIYSAAHFILFFVKLKLFGKKYKYFDFCVDVKNFILYCGRKVVKFKFLSTQNEKSKLFYAHYAFFLSYIDNANLD